MAAKLVFYWNLNSWHICGYYNYSEKFNFAAPKIYSSRPTYIWEYSTE